MTNDPLMTHQGIPNYEMTNKRCSFAIRVSCIRASLVISGSLGKLVIFGVGHSSLVIVQWKTGGHSWPPAWFARTDGRIQSLVFGFGIGLGSGLGMTTGGGGTAMAPVPQHPQAEASAT